LSPNAIGSSLASLKIPDLKDSTFSFICSFNFSRFTSKFSGITLNWIAAVAMILGTPVSAFWAFIFY